MKNNNFPLSCIMCNDGDANLKIILNSFSVYSFNRWGFFRWLRGLEIEWPPLATRCVKDSETMALTRGIYEKLHVYHHPVARGIQWLCWVCGLLLPLPSALWITWYEGSGIAILMTYIVGPRGAVSCIRNLWVTSGNKLKG